MNIKSRAAAVAALGVALSLAAAGCGAGDDGGGSGKVEGQLRVVSNWTGAEGEAFQAVIDGFEKANPAVKVKIEQVPFDQTQAQLTQQFAQGSPPDVAVALPGIIRTFSKQGLLLDLDQMWKAWVGEGAYTDSLRAIAQGADQHTDAIYFKGNVNALIWYDPSRLKKLGLPVPKTWEEFAGAADAAKKAGMKPFAVGGKDGWPLTQWVDPIILRVAGPQAFNDLARGKIGWNDPRIVKSFQVLAGLVGGYFPSDALSAGFIDATCARAQGKYLFQNQGAFVNLVAPSECDKGIKPGKDLAFFLMPPYDKSVPPAQAVSGDLFMGAKDTKHKAATLALLKYLGSADAQTIWAKRGGYIAPNAKVSLETYPNVNDREAARLWPRTAGTQAGYDLDDWIGGEIQVKYNQALADFVRDKDTNRFITAMTKIDNRAR